MQFFISTVPINVSIQQLMPGSVDGLLDGGLREGHLTELYGEPASGKTQVFSNYCKSHNLLLMVTPWLHVLPCD